MSDNNESEDEAREGHSYEGVEAAAIQKEVTDLQNLWNAYVELTSDGRVAAGLHPPPAFMAMYSALLDINKPLEAIMDIVEHTQENYDALSSTLTRVVAFGDAMFRFGQWCVSQGLLHANAIQCQCGAVDDDELSEVANSDVKVDLSDDALRAWLEGGKGA